MNLLKRSWIFNELKELAKDESGIGVIEVVLILVVLIGLVAIFKSEIGELLDGIFVKIRALTENVY